jgi:hypothetical protein
MKGTPAGFTPQLLMLARKNISGELAWQYPTILEVVAALAAQGYAILGGDVMHDERGQLDYYHGDVYCGNWYLDWKPDEWSWPEYIVKSVSITTHYIEDYVQRNDGSFWYVPVFADEEEHVHLRQRSS